MKKRQLNFYNTINKRYFKFVLVTLLALFSTITYAQNITGSVTDQKNNPLDFATIFLKKDTNVLQTTISNTRGAFSFDNLKNNIFYTLSISLIGYKKLDTSFIPSANATINISLQIDNTQLKTVTVTSKKPLIERKIDRIIFNVENSILATGENGFDLLKNTPGILVDGNDNVLVRGKSGVKFMIDDKPVYLSGEQLRNYLRSLTSDNIKSIELITNPSAKYDAAGTAAIININLKKGTKRGANGTVSTRYNQGIYGSYGASLNLNYGAKNANYFINYDYGNNTFFDKGYEQRRYLYPNLLTYFEQNYFDKTKGNNNFLRLGADYSLNEKSSVGFSFEGTTSFEKNPYTGNTAVKNNSIIDSFFLFNTYITNNFNNLNSALNFKHTFDTSGKEILIAFDNSIFSTSKNAAYQTQFYKSDNSLLRNPEILNVNDPTNININSLKIDLTLPYKKIGKFETGIKTSFIRTDNNIKYFVLANNQYVIDSLRTNHFLYKENINAAYINWSKEFKKITLQVGLRAEQTNTIGNSVTLGNKINRHYFQLFPSLFIQKILDKKNQFTFNYSRRIQRPNYEDLNPFQFYFDPYSYKIGNPFLNPQTAHSFELAYTFVDKYSLTLNYSSTSNLMSEISTQDDATKFLMYNELNLAKQRDFNIALDIPLQIKKWWELDLGANGHRIEINSPIRGFQYNGSYNSYNAYLSNEFSLPKNTMATIDAVYYSPLLQGVDKFKSRTNVYFGIKKSISKKIIFKLNVTDIFRTSNNKALTDFQNQYTYIEHFQDTRKIKISFTYKFSKGKKVSAHDFKNGNEDEKNRVKQSRYFAK